MASAGDSIHPVAIEHLPMFITPPGETDVLLVTCAVILAVSVLGFGVFFFRLHSLPEHIAHKSDKMQAELVAVLCLISLFTHMHIFWIIGLVLAMIELPDFGGPLSRIAGSTEKLAGFKPGEGDVEVPRGGGAHGHAAAEEPPPADAGAKQAEAIPLPAREAAQAKHRGRAHA
ncbi:MAG: hypothetical protein WCE79_29110 [Xanthobacteraceae bacterium]